MTYTDSHVEGSDMSYGQPDEMVDTVGDYAREVAEVMQVEPEPEEEELHGYRVVDRIDGTFYMTVFAPDPSLAFERATKAMKDWYFDTQIDILF
jgi:alkylated DNA nucleotide flippase Atl1